MASIVKRNGNYSVVYNYLDPDTGKTKQKWISAGKTLAEARTLRGKIEAGFLDVSHPATLETSTTVKKLLNEFVDIYGKDRWGLSGYDNNLALINNYIMPLLGDVEVRAVTPRVADNFIRQLQETPAVSSWNRKAQSEFVTPKTIEKIVKLLRTAFKQAIRWEMTEKNPFDLVNVPRTKYTRRDIWTADTIRQALDACKDNRLYICINISFACSCRLGEILGLTWNNVAISDDDIAADNASIYIDKELARCTLKAMDNVVANDVMKIFKTNNPNSTTRVVLKKPKTESSIRKIWLPKTLAYILRDWRQAQEKMKIFLGNEYEDNNLVICLENGRPCEARLIEESFQHLKDDAALPNVVFHSLRHSSCTYKLKLNHGDLKATQGDTGHAEMDMITDVYAHILDEDRKVNAQKFEASFYANPALHAPMIDRQEELIHRNTAAMPVQPVTPVRTDREAASGSDVEDLFEKLKKNPAALELLKTLLSEPNRTAGQ